jgi:hypothetical protein
VYSFLLLLLLLFFFHKHLLFHKHSFLPYESWSKSLRRYTDTQYSVLTLKALNVLEAINSHRTNNLLTIYDYISSLYLIIFSLTQIPMQSCYCPHFTLDLLSIYDFIWVHTNTHQNHLLQEKPTGSHSSFIVRCANKSPFIFRASLVFFLLFATKML